MRPTYDFSPLFRPSIGSGGGFEPLENAVRAQTIDRRPPYHIEKTGDDRGCITLAVDGFSPDELGVLREPNRTSLSCEATSQAAKLGSILIAVSPGAPSCAASSWPTTSRRAAGRGAGASPSPVENTKAHRSRAANYRIGM